MSRPLRPAGRVLAEDARRHHRALVLQHLFRVGPASRADLARATGLTRVTVSDLTADLLADGLVRELGTPAETRIGKPPTLVGLDVDAVRVLAIDLSQDDAVVGAVLDLAGEVKARARLSRRGRRGRGVLAVVLRMAQRLADLADLSDRPVLGLGIGSMGVVDDAGVVREAPNLGWRDLDLATLVAEAVGVPVHVVNDADAAVLGEHTYGGSDAADLMVVRIATGVGAGLVVGGSLVHGHSYAAGELGHVVVDEGSEVCACGRVGCLETLVAEPALRRAKRPPEESGAVLGRALAPVVAALNLRELVVCGPADLVEGGFVDGAREVLRARVLPRLADDLVVRTSDLEDDVVLAGACVLVLSRELGVS
jgi:predicted NBD/HSP70 family sugar kinase